MIAVLVIDNLDDCPALIETLLGNGIGAIELALRTPVSLDALAHVGQQYPDMCLGAGTVLSPEQVKQVKEAGADFAVAPGLNRRVLEAAAKLDLPFAPGVATPSDIEQALECGCWVMKFFPSESMGGLNYLKSIANPYEHLGLSFIPLGGVNAENAGDYLSHPLIALSAALGSRRVRLFSQKTGRRSDVGQQLRPSCPLKVN